VQESGNAAPLPQPPTRNCSPATPDVREISDVGEFTRFYAANLGDKDSYFDLTLIAPLIAAARAHNQGRILAAVDAAGVVHAAVCLVRDNDYLHYFLSSRDSAMAHCGAVSLLLWHGIEIAQERGLCLDFDGGITTEARFRFAVAFGGELANRYEVSRSSLRYRLLYGPGRLAATLIRRLRRHWLTFCRLSGAPPPASTTPVQSGLAAIANGAHPHTPAMTPPPVPPSAPASDHGARRFRLSSPSR